MEFDYSRQYNKFSSGDLAISPAAAKRYLQELEPYLPKNKSESILEIGPGNGRTIKLLSEMGFTSVIGLEVDKTLAENAHSQGLNVEHISADKLMEKLSSDKERYSLVFCMHVIEHVPKEQQLDFVKSVNLSLKNGGYFICETPNALSPVANYYRYNDWTHTSSFTPVSLEFLFENGNFYVLYSGNALDGPTPPRGGVIVSFIKNILEMVLKSISRGLYRIHYVAHFGFSGLTFPLRSALIIVGRKE